MNKLTAHHMVRGWMLFCLFCLATSHIPAQICPDYPRNMDEVLVCFGPDGLAFEQSATLHNPVKFRFPVFLEGVIHVDFADGNGSVSVLSDAVRAKGYTTFRLAGAGIAQHFIRIESELRVPAGRNIDLRQGAVQIDGVRRAKC